jgi:hypothetical protein
MYDDIREWAADPAAFARSHPAPSAAPDYADSTESR